MAPALVEDAHMHDAPPLNLQSAAGAASSDHPDQLQIPPTVTQGPVDPNTDTSDALSDRIDHLKLQPRSGYAKLTPEQFLQRRADAVRSNALTNAHTRALSRPSLRTGLCYDVRMRYHATLDEEDVHPEDPRRIHVIYQTLTSAGLTKLPEDTTGHESEDDLMLRIRAREVTEEEVLLVHTPDHWRFLTTLPDLDKKSLLDLTRTGDSVFYNNQSFTCAKLSCGGSIETCKAVWTGQVKNAIAVVRPPGHHAEPHKSMGFCLFNNVAVAARVIRASNPECKRIMILDWDVHHGNGTQTAFYKDDSVLYVSLHRFDGGTFYPPYPDGDLTYCGEGKGLGYNVNIPWATGGIGDADYIYAFQRVVMPIAFEYEPDLVIISAGFDAAAGDKIGECFVTPAGYAHMTHMLMSLANGKVAVCLEGGYNLNSISNSALAVAKTLMGEPPGALHDVHASPKVVEVVNQVIIQQSRHWKSMEYKSINNRLSADKIKAKRLHDIIRQFQARTLFDTHGMTTLLIVRPNQLISPTFEEQILSTPNYDKSDILVVIVHDSADLLAAPDPGKDTIQTHNSFVVEPSQAFVEWAITENFGVIDVNIPKFVTPNDEVDETCQRVANNSINDDPNALMVQLWDNYIDLSNADKVVFIGIGEGYRTVLNLISLRDCVNRVVACVSFISGIPLCAVNTTRDESIGFWYHKHSRVYVPVTHDALQAKRLKMKYGVVEGIPEDDLDSLVQAAYQPALNFIKSKLSR